ncbi:MAG: DUF378 domain-containing protein [Alphaproteobacteria bacterium]|nr:DUF378 domain-containing protein [Alphaproteobacteria bacterium]
MRSFLDWFCLPLVIFGALNYGIVELFRYDLFSLIPNANVIRGLKICIGLAGLGLFTGWYGRR